MIDPLQIALAAHLAGAAWTAGFLQGRGLSWKRATALGLVWPVLWAALLVAWLSREVE